VAGRREARPEPGRWSPCGDVISCTLRHAPFSVRVLRRFAVVALVVAAWALTSNMAMAQGSGDCRTGVVTTTTGPVCGQIVALDGVGEVQAFLGIPYAEAPVGDLRWRAPVPRTPWDAPWAANAFGSRCAQNPGLEAATTTGIDEDCLSVNVWTPGRDGVGRPVLVFIHGGAFVTGSSAAELTAGGPYLYDGSRFAATQDVVVVSLNYRVGALGFLAGIGDLTGNYGLLDQQLALAWVRENAHAFGGDATRITLAGESAGAISVATHLTAMPSSANLFLSAILQSYPAGLPFKDLEEAGTLARAYVLAAGCGEAADPVACLRRAPLERLLAAQAGRLIGLTTLALGIDGLMAWSPTVDGEIVVGQPLRLALDAGVSKPLLVGANAGEGYLFAYGDGSRLGRLAYATGLRVVLGQEAARVVLETLAPPRTADHRRAFVDFATDYLFRCPNLALARSARAPVYVYEFDHVTSFNLLETVEICADAACHGDELPFVFGVADGAKSFTREERALSELMQNAWGAFVRRPFELSSEELSVDVRWPWFTARGENALSLALPVSVGPANAERCDVYDAVGYGF
jgi:carboxylesterase type B